MRCRERSRPAEAARAVIPAYLGAHGPASIDRFNLWLYYGGLRKTDLKGWYADLVDTGDIVEVDIEGEPGYVLASEVDRIATTAPFDEVRLLPAFDQYVLGPGTKDPQLIGAKRRNDISRAAGWISAVVVHRGRVAGTWDTKDGELNVVLFKEAGQVPRKQIAAEADRIGAFTGKPATPRISTG